MQPSGCAGSPSSTRGDVSRFPRFGARSACAKEWSGAALAARGFTARFTAPGSVGVARYALSDNDPAYHGLNCYIWQLEDDGTLMLDVLNVEGGCKVVWDGHGEPSERGMRLITKNRHCLHAVCGSCIYDFAFELPAVAPNDAFEIELLEDNCQTREPHSAVSLPLTREPSGARCRPAHPNAVGQGLVGCGSRLHDPCGEKCPETSCEEGLVCAELVANDTRCLQPCTTDADCPLPGVLSCDAGFCRIAEGASF